MSRNLLKRIKRYLDPSLMMMFGILAITITVVGFREGAAGILLGFDSTWQLCIRAIPVTFLGLAIAGMMQVLVPPGAVGRFMGENSGFMGLVIGMGIGVITPGGPYVMYPIGSALMAGGAGIGPMAGYASARNLITLNRLLIWELPFLGVPFTLTRIAVSLWMPVVTVIMVPVVHRLLPRALRDTGPSHRARVEKP